MTSKYKYFCGECGYKFETNMPEKDKVGLHNDIYCPHCGGYDVYSDTPEGHKEEFKVFCEYDNELLGYED